MDKKLKSRLISCFFIFPTLIFLCLWDIGKHFPLSFIIILISVLGTLEIAAMLKKKGIKIPSYYPFLSGLSLPTMAYLENWKIITTEQTSTIFVFLVMIPFLHQIFLKKEEEFTLIIQRVTGSLFVFVYPGLFIYYAIKILSFDQAPILMIVFGLSIAINDISAWFWGNLFGQRFYKPFPVSPQKSLVGFIGGTIATFFILISAFFLFPGLLGRNFMILLFAAALLSFSSVAGDLFESSLKRSCGIKDSGFLIPGRGGILDSFDSYILSLPIFHVFLTYRGE